MAINELPQIDIPGMCEAIKWNVIKLNEPCNFLGTFGIGKSAGAFEAVNQLNEPGELEALLGDDIWYTHEGKKAKYKGVMMHDACRLSSYDGVDMRGTPWPDKTTLLTMWFAPGTFPWVGNDAFPDDKIIVLFLDEFTSANEDVQAVCYQLILDRAIGEHKLKPNVRIMLAGNLDDDHGIVRETPMPLNNRLTHFQVVMTVEAWCNWALANGVSPMFVAFLQVPVNNTLLNTYDPKTPTRIVATPRTIVKADNYYKSDMPEWLKVSSMKGCVGAGWVAQFMGFLDVWRKVLPIRKIIADPMGVELPTEISMLYATVISVASELDVNNIEPLYKFLTRLDAMYVVLAMTLATSKNKALYGTNVFVRDYTKRYRDVYNRT